MPTYPPALISAIANHCCHTGAPNLHAPIACDDCATIVAEVHDAGFRKITDTDRIITADQADGAATILANCGEMLAHLVMDTTEDQARTDKIVALFRDLSATFRNIAERTT